MTVTDWNDRGSFEKPWRPNYLYLVDRNERRDLRIGFNPETEAFQMAQIFHSGALVTKEFDRADECVAAAGRMLEERLSSWFLWRMVEDRDGNPRAARAWTRGHEFPGGTRVAA